MKSICFYFQVHQPIRLKNYRFFDIGYNHYYYNDFENKTTIKDIAEKSYLPMNNILLDIIKEYGSRFKASFTISGIAIDQLEKYAPEVLESFKDLAKTGCIEFIAEPYAHSLVSLRDNKEFKSQVDKHANKMEELFGKKPTTIRNTAMIYSDEIGSTVNEMGYDLMLTEGAKHILGWKSPNYMYCNATNPKLKLLLKNYQLSDDIGFRFSRQDWIEWPLTTEKFIYWLNKINKNEEVVNLFIDYSTFGGHHSKETGIFEFMRALPQKVFQDKNFIFNTPSEIAQKLQPISPIYVPHPISWADEERDITAWLGNELQNEAFNKLYDLSHKIKKCSDPFIHKDWENLQASDHFYYMSTKWFSDGEIHNYHNPFNSPYEAFINYMNIISDFEVRINNNCNENGAVQVKQEEKTKNKTIIKEEKDPKSKPIAKKKVRKSTFKLKPITFTKLVDLPDSTIKDVVKEVDVNILADALKGAKYELKEKIYKNVGKRASKRIEDILKESKNISRDATKEARQKIEIIAQKFI